jgi:methanogenic corrinoid protein MtbC1/DNA-binding XRE family transcriptional regulator
MPDFATRLKTLRTERGMRQKDLAAALGLAQTTIANYEQKLRFPDEPMLVKIADHFSVSLDYLLGRGNGTVAAAESPVSVNGDANGLPDRAAHYLTLLRGSGLGAAREWVHRITASGTPLQEVYLGIFAPALREVGRLWALGQLPVGEEHALSEATLQMMAFLSGEGAPAGAAATGPRCVVAAVSGETHVIGARMVADLLMLSGFDVRYLGGNISIGALLEVLRAAPPALLALSVSLPEHVSSAADMVRAVRADRGLAGVRILVGGRALSGQPGLAATIGADASATDAEEAVRAARRLAGIS